MRTFHIGTATIEVYPDAAALNRAGAEKFIRAAKSAIAVRQRFAVALSGGSTPKAIYSLLAEQGSSALPWDKVEIFFGDERVVPPEHPDSNYRMAHEALLSRVPLPPGNIHRMRTELGAKAAAQEYEAELRAVCQAASADCPSLDLLLLGLGPDGHTASLFPGTTALTETRALVTSNWVVSLGKERLTLTYRVINEAAEVVLITGGKEKAPMLRNILRGDPSGATYPAQLVQPRSGRLLWMVDEAAAGMLG